MIGVPGCDPRMCALMCLFAIPITTTRTPEPAGVDSHRPVLKSAVEV